MNITTKPRVAVLVGDGYQELEFWYPLLRLREEEITAEVVGLDGDRTYVSHLGYPVIPNVALADLSAETITGVVIPGGPAGFPIAWPESIARFVRDAGASGAVIGEVSRTLGPSEVANLAAGQHVVADGANDLPNFFKRFLARLARPGILASHHIGECKQ